MDGAAFDLHSAGGERDGDLSVHEGRHGPRSGGGTEYRRRYGRHNAQARYRRALDDRGEASGGGRGRLGWGDSDFDHELPTDEVEAMLALTNIFLVGTGRMNPCSHTAAAFWVGVLGRVEGTTHRCWSGVSLPKSRRRTQPRHDPACPSRIGHARQRWAHHTTL